MVLPKGQFRFLFTAKNYADSVAFYRDGLGLAIDHDWDFGPADRGTVFIAGTGMIEVLAPVPGKKPEKPAGGSLLIEVENMTDFHQMCLDRGLKIVQEPTDYPWGHRIIRLQDPDGIILSFFAPIQD